MNCKPANMYDALKCNPCFSTLISLIDLADLTTAVKALKNSTLFAPNNDAFKALPAATLAFLTDPANKTSLQSVLLYHLTGKCYSSCKLYNGQVLTMLNTQTTTVIKNCCGLYIKDVEGNNSKVYGKDCYVCGCNVIHKICKVLIPKL